MHSPIAKGDIVQFFPFVHTFYSFESPLFYSQHDLKGEVTIIHSTMKTLQSDPLGGLLFAFAHFQAFCFVTT